MIGLAIYALCLAGLGLLLPRDIDKNCKGPGDAAVGPVRRNIGGDLGRIRASVVIVLTAFH